MAKFLFLGDSLTYGYDVTPGYGWVELLQEYWFNKQKNISVVNAGINGDTLQGMLNRLGRADLLKYDYIFIMGGSNDILMGRDAEYCFRKLMEIVTFIRESRPHIPIFVGVPMESIFDETVFNKTILAYRNMIWASMADAATENSQLHILDFYTVLHEALGRKEVVFAGDVHPNAKGYYEMFRYARDIMMDFC